MLLAEAPGLATARPVSAAGLVDIDARICGRDCGGDAGLGDKNAGGAVGKDAGANRRGITGVRSQLDPADSGRSRGPVGLEDKSAARGNRVGKRRSAGSAGLAQRERWAVVIEYGEWSRFRPIGSV